MQKLTQTNEVFNGIWEIKKCIGKGSFSEIFAARDRTKEGNQLVAIKVQNQDFDSSVIRWESEVLKALTNVSTVPSFIYYGNQDKRDFLVMELLGGEDMAGLRNRIRSSNNTGLVALPGASYLTRQMLSCIKSVHEHGFVHRDIKPANFVRNDKNSTQFSTIDFGIAKLYRDRDGQIKPKRERAEFRGTTMYASVYTHEGHDQAPRDDLFSIMYVFLDLLCGKLPWTDATRAKDKPLVASLKRHYFDQPDQLMKWVHATVTLAEMSKPSLPGSTVAPAPVYADDEDYDGNFPKSAQKQTVAIFKYLKTLQYEDMPDYDFIDQTLINTVEEPSQHNVSDVAYTYRGFFWTGGSDRFESRGIESAAAALAASAQKRDRLSMSVSSSALQPLAIAPTLSSVFVPAPLPVVDYFKGSTGPPHPHADKGSNDALQTHRLHQVCSKMNIMLKENDQRLLSQQHSNTSSSNSSSNSSSSSGASPSSVLFGGEEQLLDISVGVRWKNLVRDLMSLNETTITLQVAELFHLGLVTHDGFFAFQPSIDNEVGVWNSFVEIQAVANDFYELYERIRKAYQTTKANGDGNENSKKPRFSMV